MFFFFLPPPIVFTVCPFACEPACLSMAFFRPVLALFYNRPFRQFPSPSFPFLCPMTRGRRVFIASIVSDARLQAGIFLLRLPLFLSCLLSCVFSSFFSHFFFFTFFAPHPSPQHSNQPWNHIQECGAKWGVPGRRNLAWSPPVFLRVWEATAFTVCIFLSFLAV